MRDQEIRAALDRHWTASGADDFDAEHELYLEDAALEYPPNGSSGRAKNAFENRGRDAETSSIATPAVRRNCTWIAVMAKNGALRPELQ